MGCIITDLETWIHDFADEKIFHIYLKNKDKEKNDDVFLLVEAVELPNKDILLGFKEISNIFCKDENFKRSGTIEYFNLSEINLVDISEKIKKNIKEDD